MTSLFFQAKLESKLAQLYKHLLSLQETVQSVSYASICETDNKTPINVVGNKEVPKVVYNHLNSQLSTTSDQLKDVSSLLLELCVLVPSAPWVIYILLVRN